MVRKRIFQAVLALVMLGTTVAVTESPAFAASYGPYVSWGFQSQKCTDDPNSATGNNVALEIWTCNGGKNQQWYYEDTGDGYYWIVNVASGKCLTVKNAALTDNTPIIQYACNYGANEEWSISPLFQDQNDYYYYGWISNRRSGSCLTVQNESSSNGGKLVQFTCNYGGNEEWMIDYRFITQR